MKPDDPADPRASVPHPAAQDPQVAAEAGTAATAGIGGENVAEPGASRNAPFGPADEEVARLTTTQGTINYYAALKLTPETMGDLRKNYFKLSRLVHPDKCANPKASEAQAVVTQAYDTLSNPVKKKLYDAYATNTTKPDNMSYAEWESRQVEIPKWLERILRVPGGGICLLITLIPLLIILFIFMLLLWVVCLPVRCVCRVCCGVKLEEDEQGAPAPQQPAAAAAAPQPPASNGT